MRTVRPPTTFDLDHATVAVRQYLAPTPVEQIGPGRYLKLESQQPTGAFKVRGAIASLCRLPQGQRIVTASAGNHALGVAWAAAKLGHDATIVVPANASPRKVALLREMGASLVLHGDSYEAAEQHALALADDGGMYFSAYNDPHVISGQATIMGELLQQIDGDLTVIVPVGGGGLIAGIALRAAREKNRRISVIGVEAEASQAVSRSVAAGETIEVEIGETIADGLAGNLESGSVTVEILQEHPPTFVTVNETEIRAAIRSLYREHDIIAEGAAATSFAAMTKLQPAGTVVAIISGRNIADDLLQTILA